jgi:hypothetical protein
MGRYSVVFLICGLAGPAFGQAAAEAVLNRGTVGAKASAVAPLGRAIGGAVSRAGMDIPRTGSGNVSTTQGGSQMLVFDPVRRTSRSRYAIAPVVPKNYEPLTLAALKVGMERDEIVGRFGPPQCSIVLSDREIGDEQLSYSSAKGELVDVIMREGKVSRILPGPKSPAQ